MDRDSGVIQAWLFLLGVPLLIIWAILFVFTHSNSTDVDKFVIVVIGIGAFAYFINYVIKTFKEVNIILEKERIEREEYFAEQKKQQEIDAIINYRINYGEIDIDAIKTIPNYWEKEWEKMKAAEREKEESKGNENKNDN